MLGKLIRHEFKATWRLLLLLDAVLLGIGITGYFVMGSFRSLDSIQNDTALTLFTTSYITWFLLYFLSIFAVNIGTAIFLMIRYYRNFYSAEGYLTFTLPVNTPDLLHAKMVSGYVWSLAGLLLTLISVLLMGGGLLQNIPFHERARLLSEIGELISSFAGGTILLLVLDGLFSPLYGILTVYFCITVGQLWQKHRIAGAVLCYVALSIINRIVMSSVTISRLMSGRLGNVRAYYNGSLIFTLIYSALSSVIFYFIIRAVNARRINLD